MEEMIRMAREEDVDENDAKTLYRHGVSPALIEKAKTHGFTFKYVRTMFFKHGPLFIPMFIDELAWLGNKK